MGITLEENIKLSPELNLKKVDFFETKDIRGKLIWNATDDITVEARIAYSDADGGCCSDTFIFNQLIGNAPNPTGISTPNNNVYNKPRMNVRGKTDKLQNFDTTLKINWDLGEIDATYIFNHSDVEEEYFADRPPSERLINKKLDLRGLNVMRDWRVCLKEYIDNYYQWYLK